MFKLNKKYLIISIIIVILIMILPNAIRIFWYKHIQDTWIFSGLIQSDQITYTAIFRSVIERGNGIAYSYPYHNPGESNPAFNFQLPFTILAYLWILTGKNITATWIISEFTFGIMFLLSVYIFINALIKKFFPEENKQKDLYIFMVFLMLITGGGLAWIFSLIDYWKVDYSIPFINIFTNTEKDYHYWFLNLFRNIIYPLESYYHCLFFLGAAALVSEKYPAAILLQLVICMSAVFTGVEFSGIIILFFFIEYLVKKEKRFLKYCIYSTAVFLLFFMYYNIFLIRYPVTKSLVEQLKTSIYDMIPLSQSAIAYGFWLLVIPAIFLIGDFKKRLIHYPHGRLMLIWLCFVFFLIMNDKFLPEKLTVQPPHFTRGYFFSILLSLSAVALYPYYLKFIEKKRYICISLLLLIILFFIPDNLIFIYENFSKQPHLEVLTYPKEFRDLYDFLNTIKEQKVVISSDRNIGNHIPCFTKHSSLITHVYATPFNEEKDSGFNDFFYNRNQDSFLEKFKFDILVIPKGHEESFNKNRKRKDFIQIYSNNLVIVYEFKR